MDCSEDEYVPSDASLMVGGDSMLPMLNTLRQFLSSVSIDDGLADVLVLAPKGTDACAAASGSWLEARLLALGFYTGSTGDMGTARSGSERVKLRDGMTAIVLTQAEAADWWLAGIRMRQERKRRRANGTN